MGSIVDDLFGGGQNQAYGDMGSAYYQAMQMRQQMLQQALQGLQPYMQGGLQAYGQAMPALESFLGNLGGSLNQSFGYGGGAPTIQPNNAPMGFNPSKAGGAPSQGLLGPGGTYTGVQPNATPGAPGSTPSGPYTGIQSWMNGYQQSPQAQFQMKMANLANQNAAAAGGLLGTPANQAQLAGIDQGIVSQDMGNYYNQLQQQEQQYLGGLGGLMSSGMQPAEQAGNWITGAANGIAGDITGQGMAQAGGQMANSNMWNNMITGGMNLGQILQMFGAGM